MPATDVTSTTYIDRKPEEVYEFVTTPANWVGTHPVTREVKGNITGSAGVGESWIEVIGSDPTAAFEAEWTVTKAEPGRTWVIKCGELRAPGVVCEITYTFTPDGDGTDFRRNMVTTFSGERPLQTDLFERTQDPTPHNAYLAKVKAALE